MIQSQREILQCKNDGLYCRRPLHRLCFFPLITIVKSNKIPYGIDIILYKRFAGGFDMNIKGIFYVVTKDYMIATFGEERWKGFMIKLGEKDKYFINKTLMAVTPIPAEKLIVLFDEMCSEFFNNDKSRYELFGKTGAKYARSPGGPYSAYMNTKDIKPFVELTVPKIWSAYFDGGTPTGRLENNVAHVKIIGIPIKHAYFERCVMGYFQQAIKVFGKKSIAKQVKSIASGDNEMSFTYALMDS
jgi:hypothetical protein